MWEINWELKTKSGRPLAHNDQMILFVGDGKRSTGLRIHGSTGGSSSPPGGGYQARATQNWAGEIKPGQRVRVALPNYRPARTFHFTGDVKDLGFQRKP